MEYCLENSYTLIFLTLWKRNQSRESLQISEKHAGAGVLWVRRWGGRDELLFFFLLHKLKEAQRREVAFRLVSTFAKFSLVSQIESMSHPTAESSHENFWRALSSVPRLSAKVQAVLQGATHLQ